MEQGVFCSRDFGGLCHGPERIVRLSPPPKRVAGANAAAAVIGLPPRRDHGGTGAGRRGVRRPVRATLQDLTALPTRHSFGSAYRTAAGSAAERLAALGYATRREPVATEQGETLNVVAEKLGSAPEAERRLVYVMAHLDSINQAGGPDASAPGADDNASGAAGVMELARVLAAAVTRHDLRLVLFGGEEQGLHGVVRTSPRCPAPTGPGSRWP
jgi:hypothetical protein